MYINITQKKKKNSHYKNRNERLQAYEKHEIDIIFAGK